MLYAKSSWKLAVAKKANPVAFASIEITTQVYDFHLNFSLNPFHASGFFLYPLKASEDLL